MLNVSSEHSFNTESCCEHITGGTNVYLYRCVSLLAPGCAVCLCLCMCLMSSQSASRKQHHTLDLSKLMPYCRKHTARSLWH